MKKLYDRLPGPTPVKVLLALVIVIVVLALLIPLFEWAGDFLDDGGVVGALVNAGPDSRV